MDCDVPKARYASPAVSALPDRRNPVKFRVVLEPSEEGGFTAVVPVLPGCISEGDTREEALANVREAITIYLEPVEDDTVVGPDAEVVELAL